MNCKEHKSVSRWEASSEIRVNWNWKQTQEKSCCAEQKHTVEEKSEHDYYRGRGYLEFEGE